MEELDAFSEVCGRPALRVWFRRRNLSDPRRPREPLEFDVSDAGTFASEARIGGTVRLVATVEYGAVCKTPPGWLSFALWVFSCTGLLNLLMVDCTWIELSCICPVLCRFSFRHCLHGRDPMLDMLTS